MPAREKGRRWEHSLDVIGLKFRWTRSARRALGDMIAKRGSITGVRLIREPNNEYDENAIAVYLPERLQEGRQLGSIRREAAEVLAPKLDGGHTTVVTATLLDLDADDDYNSGELLIKFRDKPRTAKGRKGFTKPKTRT
jgi:HIRAN domain